VDQALRGVGVLLFDDGTHAALGIAHDAAVAGGIVEIRDQHGQHRIDAEQPPQRAARISGTSPYSTSTRAPSGIAPMACCTAWPVPSCCACSAQSRSGWAANAARTASPPWPYTMWIRSGFERTRGGDDVAKHRHACDRLEHLGAIGFHPFSLACGEDDDVQGSGGIWHADHPGESIPRIIRKLRRSRGSTTAHACSPIFRAVGKENSRVRVSREAHITFRQGEHQ
jgi:hypothetical protein